MALLHLTFLYLLVLVLVDCVLPGALLLVLAAGGPLGASSSGRGVAEAAAAGLLRWEPVADLPNPARE